MKKLPPIRLSILSIAALVASGFAPLASAQSVTILDNGDVGFSTTSGWTGPFTGQGYQNDVHFTASGNGSQVATWTFAVAPGTYKVAATWSPHSNRATDAPYKLYSASGGTQTVDVNQELSPTDFYDAGVGWKNLGTVTVSGSSALIVQLSNDANEYVIADAVRVEKVSGGSTPPPPPPPSNPSTIIDNGDAGFSTTSGWTGPFTGQGYQNDVHFTASGNGASTATWTFAVAPGTYKVAATWSPHSNRATDAPYTLNSASGGTQTVDVNQELTPSDFYDAGVGWKNLGTVTVSGSSALIVQLSNDANEYVIADAVRVEKIQ